MNPDILAAVFPVTSEGLTLAVEKGQTISALTTALDLRLVCWEWDDQAKAKTVWEIYTQTTQLLPEDFSLPLAGGQRVENYLLALGLTLERLFKLYDAQPWGVNSKINIWDAVQSLRFGFGNNHPLLLAKAKTVEDFTKALETKGRLGKWL